MKMSIIVTTLLVLIMAILIVIDPAFYWFAGGVIFGVLGRELITYTKYYANIIFWRIRAIKP